MHYANEKSAGTSNTTLTSRPEPMAQVFLEGKPVVLSRGPNTGTVGVFLRSRADIKWADITESNGTVRSHPVEWLARAALVR